MADYDVSTAVIVVDVQNDFAHPEGSLHVGGGEEVIVVANREVVRARDAGAMVVFTQDWHPQSSPHFAKDGGIWPVHCVGGSWGAEFAAGLDVDGLVIRKGTGGEDGYSGFTVREPATGTQHATGLASLLKERNIERVVVVGLATDYCVKETALDAIRDGFATTVLEAGVRAVDLEPGDGTRALEEMVRGGVRIVRP
jgi:nicotinamidase/pyrazinamidase